ENDTAPQRQDPSRRIGIFCTSWLKQHLSRFTAPPSHPICAARDALASPDRKEGDRRMRIAVIGVGGVGGYFGGQLAASGEDVLFVARGAHLTALRETGLTIESQRGPLQNLKVQATDDPAGHGPVDIVMLGVKLWDTDAALQ